MTSVNPDEINPVEIDGMIGDLRKKQRNEIEYLRDLIDEYATGNLPLFYRRKTIARFRVGVAYLEQQLEDEGAIIDFFEIDERSR